MTEKRLGEFIVYGEDGIRSREYTQVTDFEIKSPFTYRITFTDETGVSLTEMVVLGPQFSGYVVITEPEVDNGAT